MTGPFPGGGASRAQPVGINGGTFSVSVVVPGACRWTAASDSPWASLEGGGSFTGSRTVTYTVAPAADESRVARIAYSFDPSAVTLLIQDGRVSCASEIRPTERSLPAERSGFEVQVLAPRGCRWAFGGEAGWLAVVPEENRPSPWGDGNGTVLVVAEANAAAAPRIAHATIAGRRVEVTQAGR